MNLSLNLSLYRSLYLSFASLIGRLIFALRGWHCAPLPPYWQDKQVIIGFPHTTIMDTVMAFAGFAIVKKKGHVLVKEQAFRWPFVGILKWLGAIPVDRSRAGGLVQQMVEEFALRDEFHLSLVPEGTRKNVDKLKTGFWHIAKEARVPITCWFLDNKLKQTTWVGQVIPGESLSADLKMIQALYQAVGWEIKGTDRVNPVDSPANDR